MSVRVRFAPSPTGPLHIGGARTALFNYLFARAHSGVFVLRIDDTDKERSTKAFEDDILDSMRWLGIDWDEGPDSSGDFAPYRQSEREERHRDAALRLLAEEKAFYDDEKVLRLRYPIGEVVVRDMVCGDCVFNMQSLGQEPALLRSNGTPTYHIASVLDDVEMNITHIIRGQDHLTNTAKHQVLFEALSGKVPTFAHLPLILGEDGSKMSKRNTEGLTTVTEFRDAGYLSEALINFLSLLGWSHPEELETLSREELLRSFDLGRVNQTAAKFEFQKLDFLNGWWIRNLPVEHVAREARAFVDDYSDLIDERGPEFWESVVDGLRGKLTRLSDMAAFGPLLFSLTPDIADDAREHFSEGDAHAGFLSVAKRWCELLAEVPLEGDRDCYTVEQFKKMTKILKKELDVDAKTVFQGLRVLVTGSLSGPDLQVLASSIQRSVLQERARSVVAAFSS